jgi:excisionase family DNA binding protein
MDIPSSTYSDADSLTRGLLDCAEAAKYLNLSQSYIRKAVGGNRIPFVRIGTRTLFRRADLDSWVAEHLVPTNRDIRSKAESLASRVLLHAPRKRGGP